MAQQPTLDYQYAFDLIALEAARAGLFLIHCPNAFYAYEVIRRSAPIELIDPAPLLHDAPAWIRVEPTGFHVLTDSEPAEPVRLVVLIELPHTKLADLITRASALLTDDGRLLVLFSRSLAAQLPESKTRLKQVFASRAGVKSAAALQAAGWRAVYQWSFHGPRAIVWWLASVWLARLKRHAVADRCWYRMRAAFHAARWEAPFTTLTLMQFTPPAAKGIPQ